MPRCLSQLFSALAPQLPCTAYVSTGSSEPTNLEIQP